MLNFHPYRRLPLSMMPAFAGMTEWNKHLANRL
jgi:hypothetical protein